MPDEPPVTRTFLPLRPGMASLRSGVVTVSDISVLLSLEVAPFVRAAAGALHPPPRRAGRDEGAECEEPRRAGVARGRRREQDGGDEHRGPGRLGAPAAPTGGGVLAHGYIAMSGAGSGSGSRCGAPRRRSSSPPSGNSSTESRPAPISAALAA